MSWHLRPSSLSFELGTLNLELSGSLDLTSASGKENKVQSTKYKAPSTKHQAPSTKHKAQSTKHKAQSTISSILRLSCASIYSSKLVVLVRGEQLPKNFVMPASFHLMACGQNPVIRLDQVMR